MVTYIGLDETARDINSRLLTGVTDTLQGYIDFYDRIVANSEPGWPTFSQAIRVKALLENHRILVGDDTGVNGKTFVGVLSKLELDRQKNQKHAALVIAPNEGMLNAWSPDEINRYAQNVHAPGQKVFTLRNYSDIHNVPLDLDFIVLNWEKLSVRDHHTGLVALSQIISKLQPTLFIFDEVHNAKAGSKSLRGKHTHDIVDLTLGKYLLLLSATPLPNRYRDLGMIIHMLDPVKYPDSQTFSYAGPEVIKELLDRQMWFRLTRQDLKQELGLPDFREIEVPVALTREEAEMYFKAWSDCVLLGEGLSELRKILYRPAISRYCAGSPPTISSKLKKAKELTDRLTAEGQKVVIKTNYVRGIIDNIACVASKDNFGNPREVLTVSGSSPPENRRRDYLLFRNSNEHNVMVMSPVSEESIDLTTGNIPIALIMLEPEMTPREHTQLTGRFYRRGQKADVTQFTLVSESSHLEQMMIGSLQAISDQYKVKIPKRFVPRTIDADMMALRRAKEEIVEKIFGGHKISKQEESIYDASEVDRAVTHLHGLVEPHYFVDIGPFQLATLSQVRWRNLGEAQFGQLVKSKGWQKWKNQYEEGWEGSASHKTLEIIGRLVGDLEAKLGHAPVIVDVGSGATYFSRTTGRGAICLDIDAKYLRAGEKICSKLGIENEHIAAGATEIPISDRLADVVINSYMLFYLGQDDKRAEIESAIIETNRILKNGGLFIYSLPYTVDEPTIRQFNDNVQIYGFNQECHLKPQDTRLPGMTNGAHIGVFQKTGEAGKPKGLNFTLYNDVRFIG